MDIDHELTGMRMGTAYSGMVRLKRGDRSLELKLRLLSSHEYIQVIHEVSKDLADLPQTGRTPLMEHFMLAKRILVRASTSDVGQHDPALKEEMLNAMTMNEVIYLFKEYNTIEERFNPSLETISHDRLIELVDRLKKSPSEATTLSFLELANLARYFSTRGD